MKSFKDYFGAKPKKYGGEERRIGPRRTKPENPVNVVPWGGRRITDTVKESLVLDKPIHTKTITDNELMKHIGRSKMRSIQKHPFHQDYISRGHAGYQYHRDVNGHEHVLAAAVEPLKRKDGTETRRMVHFDFYKRSVENAHLFHNKNNEHHRPEDGGNRIWYHVKSQKEDEE